MGLVELQCMWKDLGACSFTFSSESVGPNSLPYPWARGPSVLGLFVCLSTRVGRGVSGGDPPTKEASRFLHKILRPIHDPLATTHPPRPSRCDPPAATHPAWLIRRDSPGMTHLLRPTRSGPPAATHGSGSVAAIHPLTLIGKGPVSGSLLRRLLFNDFFWFSLCLLVSMVPSDFHHASLLFIWHPLICSIGHCFLLISIGSQYDFQCFPCICSRP